MIKASFALLLLQLSCGSTSAFAQGALPMQAHAFQSEGPWFEGWYTRVTDEQNHVSFAVVTTSAIHDGESLRPVDIPGGYVAIVIRDHAVTFSSEAFPARTMMKNVGDDFVWKSAQGSVTAHETSISLPDSEVQLKIESQIPWGGDGPEGWLSNLPLPLHWYVHNIGGRAAYHLRYKLADGSWRELNGKGLVHQEKNWGGVFPASWVWLEASSRDASISLAGGDLEINGVLTHTYLLGYRTKKLSIDFNLGQGLLTSFNDSINSCARSFDLTAYNAKYKLVLRASASDFVALSIPTNAGYERNRAIESFKSKIQVQLYEANGFVLSPSYELIDSRVIEDAALEFGGDAMKCGRN